MGEKTLFIDFYWIIDLIAFMKKWFIVKVVPELAGD